jgi:hypothetical protein
MPVSESEFRDIPNEIKGPSPFEAGGAKQYRASMHPS